MAPPTKVKVGDIVRVEGMFVPGRVIGFTGVPRDEAHWFAHTPGDELPIVTFTTAVDWQSIKEIVGV